MKLLKLSVLLLSCAAATSAFAQQGGGGGRGRGMDPVAQTEQLTTELKLDATTADKVKTILTKQADARTKMREEMQASGAPPDMAKMQATMQTMQKDTDTQIMAVLNADQKKAYQAIVDARAQRAMGGGGGGGG
jgi:hypothetical protein